MIFLRAVHMYQFLGALASCYFSYTHIHETILPLCASILVTLYLGILFFIRTHSRLFYSMIILHFLQLISIKTATFGYLASLGVGLYMQFNVDHFSLYQYLATIAIFEFLPTTPNQPASIGINILVFIMLLFLSLTKERKVVPLYRR